MLQVDEAIRIAGPWAELYNNHPLVQSGVVFAHLSGLMVGGGAAVAADRTALRVYRGDDLVRWRHLLQLRRVHRTVLAALFIVVVSGVLLFAADVETFLTSPVFWVKTGLVFLLALNGLLILRTGKRLERSDANWERGWKRLAVASVVSVSLWLLIILAGAVLVSAG
jgi:hypothetical protein